MAGGFRVRVDPDAGDLALFENDEILRHFPLDGLDLGTVTALDDGASYDPTTRAIPNALQPPLDGLELLAVTSIAVTSKTASSLGITLRYPGGNQATLVIDAPMEGRFRLRIVPAAAVAPVAYFRLRPRVDATEGLYGLGESFDDVNQRGKIRPMQRETDGELESHDNEVHVPIPFLIGKRGRGLLVDSPFPGVFAVATNQAQVASDVQAMRDLDLAATGYWIDRPHATAVNTFDFAPAQFPDPAAMIGGLRVDLPARRGRHGAREGPTGRSPGRCHAPVKVSCRA